MRFKACLFVCLAMLSLPVVAGPNLVKNGDFSKGIAPWKTEFPEKNETKYAENQKWVSVVDNPQGSGKVLKFAVKEAVAADQGVKACTELIEIDPNANYEFGVDLFTNGPTLKAILEGYVKDEAQQTTGNDYYPGFTRVYRCDIHVKSGHGAWATEKRLAEIAKLPKKYKPTHVLIKLYGYYPAGEVFWRNAFLRKVP